MDSDDRLTISLPSLGKAMDMFYDKAYLQGYTAGYAAAKAEIRAALGIHAPQEESV
jgi:hypothetical protein